MNPQAEEFFAAVEAGDDSRVAGLLQANPALLNTRNEAGVSALLIAVYHGHSELAKHFRVPERPLDIFEAAAVGDLDRVRELVSEANTTSPDGFQPLGL